MVLNHLKNMIEEIREHEKADELPDAVWEEINSVEDWEVYSSRESLPVLANFETDDPDLNQLVDEVYEDGMTIAEIYEFSEAVAENPYITAQKGPTFEIETSKGIIRVYPVWKRWDNGYALVVESDDEYVDVEIFIIEEKDRGVGIWFEKLYVKGPTAYVVGNIKDIDVQEAVFESIKSWVEGE